MHLALSPAVQCVFHAAILSGRKTHNQCYFASTGKTGRRLIILNSTYSGRGHGCWCIRDGKFAHKWHSSDQMYFNHYISRFYYLSLHVAEVPARLYSSESESNSCVWKWTLATPRLLGVESLEDGITSLISSLF